MARCVLARALSTFDSALPPARLTFSVTFFGLRPQRQLDRLALARVERVRVLARAPPARVALARRARAGQRQLSRGCPLSDADLSAITGLSAGAVMTGAPSWTGDGLEPVGDAA